MDVQINNLAVFLAAVASMFVGAVWYNPKVLGSAWMKYTGIKMTTKPDPAEMGKLYGLTFLASLVTAYILAHVIFLSNYFFGHSFMQDAIMTAVWLWIGLVAARFMVHDLFEKRRKKLTLLNTGNELVTLLAMALVIGWVGL